MDDRFLLTVTSRGYGKITPLGDYRTTKRGGKGATCIALMPGEVVADSIVIDNCDDILIITRKGRQVRFVIADLRPMGRATRGVRLIKLEEDDEVVSIA